jgi:hypothetical protein
MPSYIERLRHRNAGLVVKWAVMELAEILVLVGMIGRHFVGKSEEEESKGFSRDEVKAGFLDATSAWFGRKRATRGLRDLLHLFEPV